MNTITSPSLSSYSPSPSSSQSVSFTTTRIPGRLKFEAQPCETVFGRISMLTYTVPFSMNSSTLSFNRLSRSQTTRYARSAGRSCSVELPARSLLEASEERGIRAGIATRCERWFEKSSSSPPPNSILRFMHSADISGVPQRDSKMGCLVR